MRVETNQKLIKRNRQIAQGLFFFSFAVLIAGFIITNQPLFNPNAPLDPALFYLLPTLVLPVGLISTLFSVRMTNLWVRSPRPEVVIREGLKGLSNKSALYNYYHFPARHVLICPQGVFAIVTRFQDGRFTHEGDKWKSHKSFAGRALSIMRADGIGNPTIDALAAADNLKKRMQAFAPDIEVQPLIVFVDPRAVLEVTNPLVPVLMPYEKAEPNLTTYLRSIKGEKKALSNAELVALVKAFDEATLPKDAQTRIKAGETA
ncbi:MAG: NERD domain-containing protein [Chloroflexi bacterium]|nr:NERD domain-containing protein [Chloroflexota bacterium]